MSKQTSYLFLAVVMLLFSQAAPAWASGTVDGGNSSIPLANPYVASLLLFAGFTGTMLALLLSGFAAPGLIGIVAFGLFFLGGHQAGYSDGMDVFFFIMGIILLVLELFVPSFGILGILGAAALGRAIIYSFGDTSTALISMLSALAAAIVIVTLVARRFKERGIWNRFVLRESLTTEEGFLPAGSKAALLNQEGITITPLRPAGIVDIGGERIDVVTSGEFIDQNTKVRVARVEGTRVIVKEVHSV
ncbi:NfeD family protein [Paenibacillus herberti]|uniref:Uncharacterized protein n=1 Tax=Paenibacillus herberti TaxID=1619309 RepID=A0A229P088_9BACL|nr:NfeD family protein [Paenibacillus herberti]OXM15610.1 hypothetical protein CGZ75_02435 [Paenibacillus herberti]